MRIWGVADPRYLRVQHLHDEHKAIHFLAKRGNGPGPEFDRFWSTRRGRSALLLRHELVRVAMNVRWPGHHKRGRHPTPVRWEFLLDRDKSVLRKYAVACRNEMDSWLLTPEINQQRFSIWMHGCSFPATRNEDLADTPWRLEGTTLTEYLRVEDKWRKKR